MSADRTVALVTGANRGIGLEVCRQLAQRGHTVILGSRNLAKRQQAAAELAHVSGLIIAQQLDVTDQHSIERLQAVVETDHGRLDILVNNAAILYDSWQEAVSADLSVVREVRETNTFGA